MILRYLNGPVAAEFNKLKNNQLKITKDKMNKFAVAAVMGVGVFADNHWSKLMVKVDSGYKEKYI